MAISATVKSDDGNTWYYEQRGSGPHVVLVPSGEGDCSCFENTAAQLGKTFTVTTFDMPGMSRSVPVPPEAVADVTGQLLARQVMSLMDKLDIRLATFYGCSSGGATVLYLQSLFPTRVRNIVVHETPMPGILSYLGLPKGRDERIAHDSSAAEKALEDLITNGVGDRAAWDALGPEYNARVQKNMAVWLAGYMSKLIDSVAELTSNDEAMKRRPIDWTIGGYSLAGLFFQNVEVAHRLDIPISVLPCRHFPQITIPENLAEHIEKTTKKYL